MENLHVSAELTPNPNSLKFVVNVPLIDSGSIAIDTLEKAQYCPLALALFELQGVTGVMIGTSFVSVNKMHAVEWNPIIEPIITTIKTHLAVDGPIIDAEGMEKLSAINPSLSGTEVENRIREILDTEIRPAIAMDGGDVVFYGYENGIVTLHLQGSCSSCPSSTMTLKYGIENRLREEFPEILDVVQV